MSPGFRRVGAIVLAAFCLRAGYLCRYEAQRPDQALATLPFAFEPGNIAASLATGNGFRSPFREETGPTAWMPPVYPLILAGTFRLFGVRTAASFTAAAGLNVLFSALTVVPIYFAGRRIAGARVAMLAAWLWAVFPNAIKLPVESIWDVSLAALLAAVILWVTLELAESRGIAEWYAYGLLWGLALMTTPALGSLLPLLVGWLVWRTRRLELPLVALAAAALCCVPWTLRNSRVFHSFIPLRSVAGLTLWLGTHDQSGPVWPGRLHPLDNTAERARYVDLGEVDYMREKQREALDIVTAHPAAEARAAWSHFVAIWTGGTNHPVADLRAGGWGFLGVLLFNLLAAAGAVAGAVILFRNRNPYAFPVAVFPAVFPLVYYVTLGLARYRLPMDPAILLLTAVALNSAWGTRRAPRRSTAS